MSDLEILSLIITIVSLACFAVVFTFLFRSYFRHEEEEVKQGYYDIDLIVEDRQVKEKTKGQKALDVVYKAFQYVFLGVIAFVFVASVYEKASGGRILIGDSTVYVIASGSMSEKNTANTYLYDEALKQEYNLDNQFNTYDIIGITKYKSQEDVRLYDVVAYTSNSGTTIVHRIVEIENIDGVDYYITRGDSQPSSDDNTFYGDYLRYDSIVGYYNGFRLPAVGAFAIFLQSGAGIVAVASIVYCFAMFEFFRRRLDKQIEARKAMLLSKIPYDGTSDELKSVHIERITYNGVEYPLYVAHDDIRDYIEDDDEKDRKNPIKEKENGKENEDKGN